MNNVCPLIIFVIIQRCHLLMFALLNWGHTESCDGTKYPHRFIEKCESIVPRPKLPGHASKQRNMIIARPCIMVLQRVSKILKPYYIKLCESANKLKNSVCKLKD